MYLRLMHKPFKAYTAEAKLEKYEGNEFKGNNLKVYQLNYPELERKLEIVFQDKEPYLIEGWMDSHPALLDKQMRQTIAKRTHTLLEAYWQKNNLKDLPLRKDLGMD
jgi:macrodomain Ter protein organizer (MatP/YcbG family)